MRKEQECFVKPRFSINVMDAHGKFLFEAERTLFSWGLYAFRQGKLSFVPVGKEPIPNNAHIQDVKGMIANALNHIGAHCASKTDCNQYFKKIGAKYLKGTDRQPMTLSDILKNYEIRVYRLGFPRWSQDTDQMDFDRDSGAPGGFTMPDQGDHIARIGINRLQFETQVILNSTLLHELAHVAGAPGRDEDPNSIEAEAANLHCLTGKDVKIEDIFNPEAKG